MTDERFTVTEGHKQVTIADSRTSNVLVIRPRMGFGVRNRAKSAGMRIVIDDKGKANPVFDFAMQQTALLFHNLLFWSGPDLDGVPLTIEALDDLDPDLADRALDEIGIRNKRPESPNEDSGSTATTTSIGVLDSIPIDGTSGDASSLS